MGNNHSQQSNQAQTHGQKIVLKLRYRDIILHYSFKMKLTIADIGLFPDHLEGLRLWDSDIVLSRFIILENEMFKNKDVMVFKAGVGIAGLSLSKWGGCKSVSMCETRKEVVENIRRNCDRNNVTDVTNLFINLNELNAFEQTYDLVLATDLFGEGFFPENIIYIWRKLLKVGGEAIMIVPDKKEESKKLLDLINRQEFSINNLVLTAEEYETSPLFNKLESQSQFPLLGKSTFYAICLKKIKELKIEKKEEKKESEEVKKQSEQKRKDQAPEEEPQRQEKKLEKKPQKKEEKQQHEAKSDTRQPQHVPQPFSTEDKEEERKQKLVTETRQEEQKQKSLQPEVAKGAEKTEDKAQQTLKEEKQKTPSQHQEAQT